jgi:hypothetical protein
MKIIIITCAKRVKVVAVVYNFSSLHLTFSYLFFIAGQVMRKTQLGQRVIRSCTIIIDSIMKPTK